MEIIRNPRKELSFENTKIVCSICQKTTTYFVYVHKSLFCKNCLTNMISNINQAIIEDIQME
jgi:hypothetical protein